MSYYFRPWFDRWDHEGKTQYIFCWMNLKIYNPWWNRSFVVYLANLNYEPWVYRSLFVLGLDYARPGFLRMKHLFSGPICEPGYRSCVQCGISGNHYPEQRCLWVWQWLWKILRGIHGSC